MDELSLLDKIGTAFLISSPLLLTLALNYARYQEKKTAEIERNKRLASRTSQKTA